MISVVICTFALMSSCDYQPLLLDRDMAIKINEKTTKFIRFRGRFVKTLSSEDYDYYFPYKALYLSELGYGISEHGTACFSPLLVKADTIWFE